MPLGVTGSYITGHQSAEVRGRKKWSHIHSGFLKSPAGILCAQKDDHKVAGRRALSRRDICHMLRNGNVCDIFFAQE